MASAANVVYRRHYTGCVDNGMASLVLADSAGNSSTVFETRNTVSCKKFGGDGRQCGMPRPITLYSDNRAVKQQQQMFATIYLTRHIHRGHVAKADDLELWRYCVILFNLQF